jgi:hypothetical protein
MVTFSGVLVFTVCSLMLRGGVGLIGSSAIPY